jgi:hypothetical protein
VAADLVEAEEVVGIVVLTGDQGGGLVRVDLEGHDLPDFGKGAVMGCCQGHLNSLNAPGSPCLSVRSI